MRKTYHLDREKTRLALLQCKCHKGAIYRMLRPFHSPEGYFASVHPTTPPQRRSIFWFIPDDMRPDEWPHCWRTWSVWAAEKADQLYADEQAAWDRFTLLRPAETPRGNLLRASREVGVSSRELLRGVNER